MKFDKDTLGAKLLTQWSLHITNTFGINFIVHYEEVSAVWGYHLLLYCIWDENVCPLFGGVC